MLDLSEYLNATSYENIHLLELLNSSIEIEIELLTILPQHY